MGKERGRSISLSPFRRLVTDLMAFSQRVPAVTVERRMNLRELAAARDVCIPKPSWAVLFTRALALVARSIPELRRSYMTFPWIRFYEHPYSTVALNVAREVAGETIVTQCLISRVASRSVAELDSIVRRQQVAPLEELRWYRRAITMSKLPWPIRPLIWWGSLNVFGKIRCHNFGTFGISSVAQQGAGIVHLIPILTSMLHYSLFDDDGDIVMRFTFDHRVMDGVVAARILVELERTLLVDILGELTAMRATAAA